MKAGDHCLTVGSHRLAAGKLLSTADDKHQR